MDRKIIYLVSAAGNPNFGDDLIAVFWIRWLRERYPDHHIVIDCLNPSTFSIVLQHYQLLYGVMPVNYLWRITYELGGRGFYEGQQEVQSAFAGNVWRHKHLTWPLKQIVARIDTIHFIGGGYLSDKWAANLALLPAAVCLKKQCGARLVMTGAGISLTNPALQYDLLPWLAAFDHASARDGTTSALLKEAGAKDMTMVDDIVLGLPMVNGSSTTVARDGKTKLVICMQRDVFTSEDYARMSRCLLGHIRSADSMIETWQCHPGSDDLFSEFLDDMGVEHSHIPYMECLDRTFLQASDDAVSTFCIGSRFHFHFVNAWKGRMGAFLSSGDYYDTKHELVVGIGSGWGRFPDITL
jgi:polysaccharide pyruvyl transferase WcaK-like protein